MRRICELSIEEFKVRENTQKFIDLTCEDVLMFSVAPVFLQICFWNHPNYDQTKIEQQEYLTVAKFALVDSLVA